MKPCNTHFGVITSIHRNTVKIMITDNRYLNFFGIKYEKTKKDTELDLMQRVRVWVSEKTETNNFGKRKIFEILKVDIIDHIEEGSGVITQIYVGSDFDKITVKCSGKLAGCSLNGSTPTGEFHVDDIVDFELGIKKYFGRTSLIIKDVSKSPENLDLSETHPDIK